MPAMYVRIVQTEWKNTFLEVRSWSTKSKRLQDGAVNNCMFYYYLA